MYGLLHFKHFEICGFIRFRVNHQHHQQRGWIVGRYGGKFGQSGHVSKNYITFYLVIFLEFEYILFKQDTSPSQAPRGGSTVQ